MFHPVVGIVAPASIIVEDTHRFARQKGTGDTPESPIRLGLDVVEDGLQVPRRHLPLAAGAVGHGRLRSDRQTRRMEIED